MIRNLLDILRGAAVSIRAYSEIKMAEKKLAVRFPNVKFMPAAYADEGCSFEDGVVILANSNLSATRIGRRSYVGKGCTISKTTIGRYCSLGTELICGMGQHPTRKYVSTHPVFFSERNEGCLKTFVKENIYKEHAEIAIGHDVWIGARVIILDGVKIGDGAVIGAGAVVTKDIPAYAVAGGVPAKIIRYRFEPDEVEFLLKLSWWEKDESWIIENAACFRDISELRKLVEGNALS